MEKPYPEGNIPKGLSDNYCLNKEDYMNIQPYQLIILACYVAGFYAIYKWEKARVYIVVLMLAAFFANPFRMTTTPIKSIERGTSRFDDMPSRVIVETPSFDDFNKSEIDKLNKLYEETKDEIHN